MDDKSQIQNGVNKPVIFFDGVCGMCNTFINLIIRIDRKQTFLFAPLQGSTARDLLPPLTDDAREWSIDIHCVNMLFTLFQT